MRHEGVLAMVAVSFIFGWAQFGLLFALTGLLCGGVSALASLSARWYFQILASVLPAIILPGAALASIVWSNEGHIPIIQDTTPYLKAAAPTGLLVGLLAYFVSRRLSLVPWWSRKAGVV